MASSAKTLLQHPPKMRDNMTDTAKKDGIVSMKNDIVWFRGGEDRGGRSFSCAFWGSFVAFADVEVEEV